MELLLTEQGVEIPLKVITTATGLHTINFNGLSNFSNASCIIVEDLFTGNSYNLKTVSSFTAFISDTTTIARFLIKFGTNTTASTADVSCYGNNDGTVVLEKDGAPFDIIWKDNQGATISSSTNVIGSDSINNLTSGNYTIETIDPICGSVSETIIINEPAEILAQFNVSTDTIYLSNGGNISFMNGSLNANYYDWNFGDGNSSNLNSPTHQYTQAGNYVITLIAYQNANCFKSSTKNVPVLSTITSVKNLESFDNTKIWISNSVLNIQDNELEIVEVRNVLGQLLFDSNKNNNHIKFNLDRLSSQTLIVSVIKNNKISTTKINYIRK